MCRFRRAVGPGPPYTRATWTSPLYIVVGRSTDCDLILKDPSVSGRHARLSWRGDRIHVEDLGSANGTWLDGKKVRRADVRPGSELSFGNAPLRWSDPTLKRFLRRGARGDTLVGVRIPGRRFICGSCGARGVMPPGFTKGQLKCGSCSVELAVGKKQSNNWGAAAMMLLLIVGAGAGAIWLLTTNGGASADSLRRAAERLGIGDEATAERAPASPQERSIRARIAPRVREAMTPTDQVTRNAAVRIAAQDEGTFRVEQVARIWSHVRGEWELRQ